MTLSLNASGHGFLIRHLFVNYFLACRGRSRVLKASFDFLDWQVSVTAREDVPPFGPPLPHPAMFRKVRDAALGLWEMWQENKGAFKVPAKIWILPYPIWNQMDLLLSQKSHEIWFLHNGLNPPSESSLNGIWRMHFSSQHTQQFWPSRDITRAPLEVRSCNGADRQKQ